MDNCTHKNRYTEFRDQFPRNGEKFIPEANGIWYVCKDCGHEEQDSYLTSVEEWGRKVLLDEN